MTTDSSVDVSDLILRKSYDKAAKILRARLASEPGKTHLRQQLADVLLLDGHKAEALPLLQRLADDFAREGSVAKAVAVLKKIQREDPSVVGIDAKIARLFRVRESPPEQRPASTGRPQVSPASPPSARRPLPPPPDLWRPLPLSDVSGEDFIIERRGEGHLEPSWDEPEPLGPASGAAAEPARSTPLSQTPLFSDFDDSELVAIMEGLKLQTFEAGDIIVSEGEPGSSLFLLSTGTVRAWVKDGSGKALSVRTMMDGDFFGEVSLLTGQNRTATITAATHCELLELDHRTVESITATHPRVGEVLRDFCRSRIEASEERVGRRTA